ncbi:hypothetical protein AAFX91_37280 [Bradyrhizobium sp. 31Argb]|uniref:hypothetical protein n=1 Tax=unclassified Bradyrhizobium TaxID=2631580 RepID=UPI00102E7D4B|nr:hypothetical protein [Bradyrhizobium sp. Leo170]TAI61211.1 hypothetical protein CWO89_36435 [Bradyrhizobium sp. Leo170]
MTFRRLIAPLTAATILAFIGDDAWAQSAFPAPLPGQAAQPGQPAENGSPPVANFVSPFPSGGAPLIAVAPQEEIPDQCRQEFSSLRAEVEERGRWIRAAAARRASSDEACKLIDKYGQAEIKLIGYVESHAAKCRFPINIRDRLKDGHKTTETIQKKTCTAQQMQKLRPAGPTGDFWPESTKPLM